MFLYEFHLLMTLLNLFCQLLQLILQLKSLILNWLLDRVIPLLCFFYVPHNFIGVSHSQFYLLNFILITLNYFVSLILSIWLSLSYWILEWTCHWLLFLLVPLIILLRFEWVLRVEVPHIVIGWLLLSWSLKGSIRLLVSSLSRFEHLFIFLLSF